MKISTVLTVYILLGLVLMPSLCISAATDGITLCISVIIPSLLPFFICSKILVKNGFAHKLSKPLQIIMRPLFNVPGCGAFAFVMGILSGCPVGAKTVTDMYEKSMCTHIEAQRMLCFCNNSGPLFIIGSVAIGMLGFEEIGTTLYVSHIVSAIAVGLIMSNYKRRETVKNISDAKYRQSTDVLSEAMIESVSLTGYVCGFVIFFAVAIEILKQSGIITILSQRFANKKVVAGLMYGMCEMTNGISNLSGLAITVPQLCAVSFVLGFGGLSVILQVYGIIKKYNFSILIFSAAKLLQGTISAIITCVILGFSEITLPVFGDKSSFGILNSWAFSINIFAIFGIIILFLSILYIVCKFLRRV